MGSSVLRVGLTGNIAAGKSTVGAWMVELGCRLIDADRLGHECLEPGEPARDQVVAAFGEQLLGPDGAVDRAALGAIVFADAEARARLEAILHPAIRDKEERWLDQIELESEPAIAVTEATLLYETGSAERYQRMVVVTAPDEVRRERLAARGLDAEQASRRMASQMDQSLKTQRADYVIDNGGTLEAGRDATRAVVDRLQLDLMRAIAGSPLGPAG